MFGIRLDMRRQNLFNKHPWTHSNFLRLLLLFDPLTMNTQALHGHHQNQFITHNMHTVDSVRICAKGALLTCVLFIIHDNISRNDRATEKYTNWYYKLQKLLPVLSKCWKGKTHFFRAIANSLSCPSLFSISFGLVKCIIIRIVLYRLW